MSAPMLGWSGVVRLGLVQAALGSIVVLATSTMNRVMVVELALPAMLPGALVAQHYAVQILRPRLGFGSDMGGRRTPWILGGMAVLGAGGVLASSAIAWMETARGPGIALAVLAFVMIGVGVGSAGTSLLVLLAKRVEERRRAAAATVVWLMMIAGFVLTTILVGHWLDPYTPLRLVAITTVVAVLAFLLALFAVSGLEGAVEPLSGAIPGDPSAPRPRFREALAQVWDEPQARRFTIFVFVSMLAYSAQDLILEPFAGAVFGMSPGQSTQLSGMQHGGVLLGMLLVTLACSVVGGPRLGSLRLWTILGCLASAICLLGLTVAGRVGPGWPLELNVFALGVANGAFAVAAIGSMMSFAGTGRASREGVRMGLWGAAQAIAFGLGGFIGAAGSDLARVLMTSEGMAYGIVFAVEALLFVLAAGIAARLGRTPPSTSREPRLRLASPMTTQEAA